MFFAPQCFRFAECRMHRFNLSSPAACCGYDVPGHHQQKDRNALPRCSLSVHTQDVEIKHCLRCGEPWCYRGEGRPLRCGKCKSPYWDRPRKKTESAPQHRQHNGN